MEKNTTNSKIIHFRPWDKDRYMSPDIAAVNKLLKEDKIWNAVKHHMESYHTSQVKRNSKYLKNFRTPIPFDFCFVPQTCTFFSSSSRFWVLAYRFNTTIYLICFLFCCYRVLKLEYSVLPHIQWAHRGQKLVTKDLPVVLPQVIFTSGCLKLIQT